MCRLANIAAMIAITRLRPSSIGRVYNVRFVFATKFALIGQYHPLMSRLEKFKSMCKAQWQYNLKAKWRPS